MRKKAIIALLLVLMLVIGAPIVSVFADDFDPSHTYTATELEGSGVNEDGTFNFDDVSGLEETVLSMLEEITTPAEDVVDWLYVGLMQDEGNYVQETVAINYMMVIYNAVQIVGLSLLICYFLMDYSKIALMQGQDFTLKSMAVSLLKLGIGWLIIYTGPTIISGLFDAANYLIHSSLDLVDGGDTTKNVRIYMKKQMVEQVREMGILDCLGAIVNLLIAELGALVGNAIVLYQSVSRKIELYIRAAFVPIALGDCYNGENSTGVRYIKKLFAICLWGLGMILVVTVTGAIEGNFILTYFGGKDIDIGSIGLLVKLVLFPLAAGGMCSGIKQVCCDALGC